MPVLTRKPLEKIVIGDNIVVMVQRVKGRAVRLAIEAPADVTIKRGELRVYQPGEKKKAS